MKPLFLMSVLLCLFFTGISHAQSARQTLHHAIEQKTTITPSPERTTPQAAQYGLAFIFSSKCPYCHKFAPTLHAFARETGLSIYPFSVDGRGLPQSLY